MAETGDFISGHTVLRTCPGCQITKPGDRDHFVFREPKPGRRGGFERCHECNRAKQKRVSEACNAARAEYLALNPPVVPKTRVCPQCGIERPRDSDNFVWKAPYRGRAGLYGECRICARKRVGKWKAANPERVRESARSWRLVNAVQLRERARIHRIANRSEANAKNREWYARHGERIREARRAWRAENKNEIALYAREWRDRNPDRAKATSRRMYLKHREAKRIYSARYGRENKDKVNSKTRAYRARKRGALGAHTGYDVARQFRGQRGRCWWCDCKLAKYDVDHRIPLIKGGSNGPENIVISCQPCNRRKNAKMPWEMESPRLL